jgi:hypothetical protein
MMRKRNIHDDSHQVDSHRIGAGLNRVVCRECNMVRLEDSSETYEVGQLGIPAWMDAAAERFSVGVAT